jgi:prepilin-type N-terminal cleavage/methylation domain-containing protein
MFLPTKVKSATGNKMNFPPLFYKEGVRGSSLRANLGFTFVEVMVSLVILCCGIVLIYKSFFLCADYLNNLTCRLYASCLLDEKISLISKAFAEWPARDLNFGEDAATLEINHKQVRFVYDIHTNPLADVKSVWQVDVGISWVDGPRNMRTQRSAYMIR